MLRTATLVGERYLLAPSTNVGSKNVFKSFFYYALVLAIAASPAWHVPAGRIVHVFVALACGSVIIASTMRMSSVVFVAAFTAVFFLPVLFKRFCCYRYCCLVVCLLPLVWYDECVFEFLA